MYLPDRLALEVALEHAAPKLAAQATHLAHAHRAHDLEQLVAPRPREIRQPLDAPRDRQPREPHARRVAGERVAGKTRLQRGEQRRVQRHRVESADDRLGDVLREHDTTAADQRRLLPHSGLDERAVHVLDAVGDETPRGPSVIVGCEMEHPHARAEDRRDIFLEADPHAHNRFRQPTPQLAESGLVPTVEEDHARHLRQVCPRFNGGRWHERSDVVASEPFSDSGGERHNHQRVDARRGASQHAQERSGLDRARRRVEEERDRQRDQARHKADDFPALVQAQKRGLLADVHRRGDELPPVDPVAGGADDLRHVGPHPVPPIAAELAAVAGASDRQVAGARLVVDRVDVVRFQVAVAKLRPFGV